LYVLKYVIDELKISKTIKKENASKGVLLEFDLQKVQFLNVIAL